MKVNDHMVTHEIVLDDWQPTDSFMVKGCVHAKGARA